MHLHLKPLEWLVLNHDARIKDLAHQVMEARDVLYLGRGTAYPIALEGALKLKEINIFMRKDMPPAK